MIGDILKYNSVSVIGLAKNAGKTECVNYILRRLKDEDKKVAVTSIGIDGEKSDLLSGEPKPRITVYEGMLFVTTEKNFRESEVAAEILDIGKVESPLGRLVTARAMISGKAILSGPSDTAQLKALFNKLALFGTDITVVDGALSRLSSSSPLVTDATILATGASVASSISEVVEKTGYVHDLALLPRADDVTVTNIRSAGGKPCVICRNGVVVADDTLDSVLDIVDCKGDIVGIYIPGAVTDRTLDKLRLLSRADRIKLIVADYTKILACRKSFEAFTVFGSTIEVLDNTRLIAVCINPCGGGAVFDSSELLEKMRERLSVPVYNIRSL